MIPHRDPTYSELERLRVENAALCKRPGRVRNLATVIVYGVCITGYVCMNWGVHFGLSLAASNAWSGLGLGFSVCTSGFKFGDELRQLASERHHDSHDSVR